MQTIDVQARLEYARAAVAVLRALHLTDRTMEYNQFARAIGLMNEDEKWEAWHRNQVSDILYLVAAVQRQAGPNTGLVKLEFERIVTKDGQPGEGLFNTARIVITKNPE